MDRNATGILLHTSKRPNSGNLTMIWRGKISWMVHTNGTSQMDFILGSTQLEYPGFMPKFQTLTNMNRANTIGKVGADYTWGISEHMIQKQHHLLEQQSLYCDGEKSLDYSSREAQKWYWGTDHRRNTVPQLSVYNIPSGRIWYSWLQNL